MMNSIEMLKIVRNAKLIIIKVPDDMWKACFSKARQVGSQANF